MGRIIQAQHAFMPKMWTITVGDQYNDDIKRYGEQGEHILIYTSDISKVPLLIFEAQKEYKDIPRR